MTLTNLCICFHQIAFVLKRIAPQWWQEICKNVYIVLTCKVKSNVGTCMPHFAYCSRVPTKPAPSLLGYLINCNWLNKHYSLNRIALVSLFHRRPPNHSNCAFCTKTWCVIKYCLQDNKRLQEENRNLTRENSRLKDDPKFSKSPQRCEFVVI